MFERRVHWQSAVGHAISAGELLIAQKAELAHGEWLPWLEANFNGSERTAQNYMRLARDPQRVADLPSVREAVAMLAGPKDKTCDGLIISLHRNAQERASRVRKYGLILGSMTLEEALDRLQEAERLIGLLRAALQESLTHERGMTP